MLLTIAFLSSIILSKIVLGPMFALLSFIICNAFKRLTIANIVNNPKGTNAIEKAISLPSPYQYPRTTIGQKGKSDTSVKKNRILAKNLCPPKKKEEQLKKQSRDSI